MSLTGWALFWEGQGNSFNTVMKIATTYFAQELEKRFHIKPTDKILDYGCGPGFLADHLATRKISITGVDINKLYLEQSRKNHPESLLIRITTDQLHNKKIIEDQLRNEKFDFIILLSISQYFKNVKELEEVIEMLLLYTNDHGKIIIADVVDSTTSALIDAASLFFQCIKNRQPMAFFSFIFYLFFSNYRKVSRKTSLLKISDQSFHQIASKNLLNYEQVRGFTIHPSRSNYILTRKHSQNLN